MPTICAVAPSPNIWGSSAWNLLHPPGACNFEVALKFLENFCTFYNYNLNDVTVAVNCPVDITLHIINLLRLNFMVSKNAAYFLSYMRRRL